MKTFKDNMGQQWTVALSLQRVRAIRERIGIDLFHPTQYQYLISSLTERLTYLFLLCEEQAKEASIGADEFEQRLYGDGFADQASIALLAETENFFQKLGQTAMAILARKQIESIKAGQERLLELIDSGEFERQLDEGTAAVLSMIPEPTKPQPSSGSGSQNSAPSPE
ncbi:hypothetical protein Enr13x_42330 [Stieleria neptunia]|uniref:Uncharacterized protein n=1 Tax=Stieleria neptunia TaxID=2527979 RepID=A0A518HU33_9BACT|nr:hypothetical protein [Stieleria neptunia]QDV44368.1 hypothetical protein Enr13x_42330 [Stieleria neptunia]